MIAPKRELTSSQDIFGRINGTCQEPVWVGSLPSTRSARKSVLTTGRVRRIANYCHSERLYPTVCVSNSWVYAIIRRGDPE